MTERPEKPLLNKWTPTPARTKKYDGLSAVFDHLVKHDSGADNPDECFGCRIGAALDDWYYSSEYPVYTCKLT